MTPTNPLAEARDRLIAFRRCLIREIETPPSGDTITLDESVAQDVCADIETILTALAKRPQTEPGEWPTDDEIFAAYDVLLDTVARRREAWDGNWRAIRIEGGRAFLPALSVTTPPPSAWRPIESAPRDGTEIVLRKGDRVGAAMWVKWEKSASEYHSNGTYLGEYAYAEGEGWTYSLDGDSWDGEKSPTHWQPLPSPPKDPTR